MHESNRLGLEERPILADCCSQRFDRCHAFFKGPLLQGITKAGIPMVLYRTMGSRAALDRFLESILTSPDQKLQDYLGEALRHFRLDLSLPPLGTPQALQSFVRPTLVIAASDDVTAPGAALLKRARVLFPHATLEMLPHTKHIPSTDNASRARLCELVANFLLAHEVTPRSAIA